MRKDAELQALIGTTAFFFHYYYFVLFLCCYYGFVGSCFALVLEGQVSMAFSLSTHYSHVCLFFPLPLLRAVYLSSVASYCGAVNSFLYIHIYLYVCISIIFFYNFVLHFSNHRACVCFCIFFCCLFVVINVTIMFFVFFLIFPAYSQSLFPLYK